MDPAITPLESNGRDGPDDTAPELLPTRESLLSRLRAVGAEEAWREFFDLYWSLIYGVCRRYGLGEEDARDVVQETIIAVARRMPGFKRDRGRGSFKTWLYAITRNRVVDHIRRRARRPTLERLPEAGPDSTPLVAQVQDLGLVAPDTTWDKEWKRNLFTQAVRRVKAAVKPRQFQIFDLYVLKEWPAAQVARSLGVSHAQVFLAKHRVGRLLRQELVRLENELE